MKSSSIDNALGAMRTAGLINRGNPIRITDDGIAMLGDNWEPLPRGAGLVEHWMSRLGKAERAVLQALLAAWPGAMDKGQIADATGYSVKSSSLDNALGRLRTLQLIGGYGGEIRADETLAERAREMPHYCQGTNDAETALHGRVGCPGMGTLKAKIQQFFDDLGLSDWQKAARDAAREGRPIPARPAEEHHYRTCRDEFCDLEACRAYREGLEDGRDD